jgi:ankyrin repeat protein
MSVVAAAEAIRAGDVRTLQGLLRDEPGLAAARVDGCRSLLHVATDWPGHLPAVKASIAALLNAGADVDAGFQGAHAETPLHWAASCDDLEALDALLDAGADIEAPGSVIDGGTPLADAVAFGQWRAARRLVERGAQPNLWQAAALGLMDRVRSQAAEATPDEITNAFWCACHGGERATAEYLLERGADMHWVGHDGLTPLAAARRSDATELAAWLAAHGAP